MIQRQALLTRLQEIAPGLAPRETIAQSSCVVFDGPLMYAFNGEVFARTKNVVPDVRGAVVGKLLIDGLDKMPDADINVTTGPGSILVTAGRKKLSVVMEAEIVLQTADVETPAETDWQPVPPRFSDAVQTVSKCAASKSDDYAATCIHLTKTYMEACDNTQAARWAMPIPLRKESCLVPRSALRAIIGLGMMSMAETRSWLHFRNSNGVVISCVKQNEEYPSLDKPFEEAGRACTLSGVSAAIGLAKAVAQSNPDDVNIRVDLKDNKCRVSATSPLGSFSDVVDCKYTDEPVSFYMDPDIMEAACGVSQSGIVTSTVLRLNGDGFAYICILAERPNGSA